MTDRAETGHALSAGQTGEAHLGSVGGPDEQHSPVSTAGVTALHLNQHLGLQPSASLMLAFTAIIHRVSESHRFVQCRQKRYSIEASGSPGDHRLCAGFVGSLSSGPW